MIIQELYDSNDMHGVKYQEWSHDWARVRKLLKSLKHKLYIFALLLHQVLNIFTKKYFILLNSVDGNQFLPALGEPGEEKWIICVFGILEVFAL